MTKAEKLAEALRDCGLKRMAQAAEAGTYDKEPGKLLIDLHFAFGLKSLTREEIGKMGRLQQRIEAGEF